MENFIFCGVNVTFVLLNYKFIFFLFIQANHSNAYFLYIENKKYQKNKWLCQVVIRFLLITVYLLTL